MTAAKNGNPCDLCAAHEDLQRRDGEWRQVQGEVNKELFNRVEALEQAFAAIDKKIAKWLGILTGGSVVASFVASLLGPFLKHLFSR